VTTLIAKEETVMLKSILLMKWTQQYVFWDAYRNLFLILKKNRQKLKS
jgi:hypothetical protein